MLCFSNPNKGNAIYGMWIEFGRLWTNEQTVTYIRLLITNRIDLWSTWSNAHIEYKDIAANNAHIFIEKELACCSKQEKGMFGEKDVFYIFSLLLLNTSTRLVHKRLKQ